MRIYYRNTHPMDNFFSDMLDTWTSSKKIPPVDIYETEEAYLIEAEVAGYEEESIKLHVEDHVLTLSSEGVKEESKNAMVKEIYTPAFERSFSLPEDADEENVSAGYKNGILLISIPKVKKAEPKRIEIKINK